MKSKEIKRQEAEKRNAAFQALTTEQKRDKIAKQPGKSARQMRKLATTY